MSMSKISVRKLLGCLNDSQSEQEARHYAAQVVIRAKEDVKSVSEYIHCGHVDWDDLLTSMLKDAGWKGGRLGVDMKMVN